MHDKHVHSGSSSFFGEGDGREHDGVSDNYHEEEDDEESDLCILK